MLLGAINSEETIILSEEQDREKVLLFNLWGKKSQEVSSILLYVAFDILIYAPVQLCR